MRGGRIFVGCNATCHNFGGISIVFTSGFVKKTVAMGENESQSNILKFKAFPYLAVSI